MSQRTNALAYKYKGRWCESGLELFFVSGKLSARQKTFVGLLVVCFFVGLVAEARSFPKTGHVLLKFTNISVYSGFGQVIEFQEVLRFCFAFFCFVSIC